MTLQASKSINQMMKIKTQPNQKTHLKKGMMVIKMLPIKPHPSKTHQEGGMIIVKTHQNKIHQNQIMITKIYPGKIHQNKTVIKILPNQKTISVNTRRKRNWLNSSLRHQLCYGLCWLWLLLPSFPQLSPFPSMAAAVVVNPLRVFSQWRILALICDMN